MRINDLHTAGAIAIQNGFPCGNWNEEGRGIPQLRPFNVTDGGRIDLNTVKYVETDQNLEAYLLRPNDVIFNNTNSEDLVGKTALWLKSQRAVLSNHMTIVRVLDPTTTEPAFIALYLLYKWYEGYFKMVCRRHVNQASVSRDRLCDVPFPGLSIDEQRRIAAVLSAVQGAIERQERLIALTAELKKALMHKLFTEGTRGEPLKQTEIGWVPESWTVARLEQFTESFQYGTSVKCGYDVKGSPVLRIPNVVGGHLDITDLKFGNPKRNELETVLLRPGDLLFVRTNGVRENAGRCSMYRGELGCTCYFASYLIRVRLDDDLMPEFLEEYTRTEGGVRRLAGRSARTADGKFNINTGTLETLLVPKPSIDEQALIAGTLATVDRKARNHVVCKAALEALFRTLLHQLMTAQVRVHDLDLSALEEAAQPAGVGQPSMNGDLE